MRTIRDPPAGCRVDWQQLLQDAVTKPGVISSAYTAFHNFSIDNMLLACAQCLMRGLEL